MNEIKLTVSLNASVYNKNYFMVVTQDMYISKDVSVLEKRIYNALLMYDVKLVIFDNLTNVGALEISEYKYYVDKEKSLIKRLFNRLENASEDLSNELYFRDI